MTKRLLWGALGLGVVGAILVFGLDPSDRSAGPFNLQAVGGVLVAAAFLLAAVAAIVAAVRPTNGGNGSSSVKPAATTSQGNTGTATAKPGSAEPRLDNESLRTITGLVAVVTGIIAVGALTIIAVNLLAGEKNTESMVAITTSAFGIVSAVVSAYLGIKATVNASDKANQALATALHEQSGDGSNPDPHPKPDPVKGGPKR